MTDNTIQEIYGKNEVERDYDMGLSIDYITHHYRNSKRICCGEKLSEKRARNEVCEIIYNHIPKRKKRG